MSKGYRYPEQFRREAVELVLQGRRYQDVADALGCSTYALRTWVKAYKQEHGELPKDPTADERAEIKELKKELHQVKQERDLLKKACAVFVQDSRTSLE